LKTLYKRIGVKPWLKPIEGEAPMFESLNIFKTAHAMSKHAGLQQSLIAQNMANSDTPAYSARVLPEFSQLMKNDISGTQMRATRAGHLGAFENSMSSQIEKAESAKDPNGNSVSLETELLKSVEARRQHDRAMAIYRSGLNIIRASFGSR
jgi:flagellar basal-body rod protein FlgB